MANELKDRMLTLRGVLFTQAERYQQEAVKLRDKADNCLLEEKGKLVLQAYNMQGVVQGIVESMGLLDLALNPPPANDDKPKLILAGNNDTIN